MTLANSLVASLMLAGAVAAHPAVKHAHREAHEEVERDVTVYDSSYASPTVVPDVKIVWLDDADKPACTSTEDVIVLPDESESKPGHITTTIVTEYSTQTAAPGGSFAGGAHLSSDEPHILPINGDKPSPGHPVVVPSTLPQDAPPPLDKQPQGHKSPNARYPGISYAPYRRDHHCKSASEIDDDFSRFVEHYSLVRIYGTDCGQVDNVYRAAKAAGTKLFLGIWDLDQIEDEARKIVSGIDSDWDIVHTISVGNELVNNGQASPQQVVDGIRTARRVLRDAGYKGPVVTVDTFIATEAHPELCEASDYCAMNAHPFFDSTISAEQAGPWLADTVKRVKSMFSQPKDIIITETGWPTEGVANGLAVPSLKNQKAAISSINEAFSDNIGDVILFSAFNDLWKQASMHTFNADQYWGIDGAVSKCDQ